MLLLLFIWAVSDCVCWLMVDGVFFLRAKIDQIFLHNIADMHINDPIHEIETDETNRENDARIFVNV